MPNIAAISDFEDEILIANKSDSNISPKVTRFIVKYEPKYLKELLGFDFATLFVNGLAEDPVDSRWTALLDPNGNSMKLAIDDFIYYWWMRFDETQSTGTGTTKSKNQNADIVSGRDKVCRAWFEMVCINFQIIKYLKDNATTYPEFTVPCWYNSFYLSWGNWGYGNDIFYSDWYYGWYRAYRMPDIFIPLSRL